MAMVNNGIRASLRVKRSILLLVILVLMNWNKDTIPMNIIIKVTVTTNIE